MGKATLKILSNGQEDKTISTYDFMGVKWATSWVYGTFRPP